MNRKLYAVALAIIVGLSALAYSQVATIPPPPPVKNLRAIQEGCTKAGTMQVFSYINQYVWNASTNTWVWGVRLVGCGFTTTSTVTLKNNATGESRSLIPLYINVMIYPTTIDFAIPLDWIPGSGSGAPGNLLAKK